MVRTKLFCKKQRRSSLKRDVSCGDAVSWAVSTDVPKISDCFLCAKKVCSSKIDRKSPLRAGETYALEKTLCRGGKVFHLSRPAADMLLIVGKKNQLHF